MAEVSKIDTFRCCQQYSVDKGEAKNIQSSFKDTLVDNMAPRHIDKAGREYMEVPAVILGEQVILGNGGYEFGAELVTSSALYTSLKQWNDRPVVIYHTNGSARDLENLDNEKVGYIINAMIIGEDEDPMNIRLKCTLRLDIELLRLHDEGAMIIDTFDRGDIMELSTGYYLDEYLFQEGSYRNRDFAAIQIEIIPDHLALLPNAEGAYGIDDGGGANRENEGDSMKDNDRKEIQELVAEKLDEKMNGLPTKDEISEMVGNLVDEAFKKVEEKIQPLVNEKEEETVKNSEKYDALLAKVSEKTGVTVDVLNGTPGEVLDFMLVKNEEPALPHEVIERTDAKLNHSTDPKDEEEK